MQKDSTYGIFKSGSSLQDNKKTYKIIVIGDSGVGKTCLTYRFCEKKCLDKPEATIGVDFRERNVKVDDEEVKLQLWDTAGQERFRKCMVQHYYRNTHAVVIVYDVTKMASFLSLSQWLEECEAHQLTSQMPRILVGNKCDCKNKQEVNTNMAQRFADVHFMPLFEASAQIESEGSNVDAIFLTLAHKLVKQRPMMRPPDISTGSSELRVTDTPEAQAEDLNSCLC